MAHSQPAWLYAPKYALKTLWIALPSMLSSTLPMALDGTLPACLTIRSQVSSQDSQVHLRVALKYAPNCTRWYSPSLLGSTPPSTLSREKTLPISLDYMLPCMLLHAGSRDLQSCRRQAPGGVRLGAYGRKWLVGGVWCMADGGRCMVAEIMTSVDIIVWTLSLAQPPQQHLKKPHTHGVDNCSLRFRRKGRQLNLVESRSPTQISQRNLAPLPIDCGRMCAHSVRGWWGRWQWSYCWRLWSLYQKYLSKLVGCINVSIKASTDLEPSTSQSFYRPRAFY